MPEIQTTGTDAITYAEELSARGYDHVYVWHFYTQTNRYDPTDRRANYAHGYAVNYSGRIILNRETGERAPHSEGVVIICDPDTLPLDKLVKAGRALITIAGEIAPYYLASYNPRDTELRCDQSINPGIYPQANFREITAGTCIPDAPATFYHLQLTPAGDVPERFSYNA